MSPATAGSEIRRVGPADRLKWTHLKARETRSGGEQERKRWKLHLIKMLYQRGYERQDVVELFRFIDWLLVLPEPLE